MTPLEENTFFHSQLNHARFLVLAEKLIHSTCAEYTSLRAEMVRWIMGPKKNEGVSQASPCERSSGTSLLLKYKVWKGLKSRSDLVAENVLVDLLNLWVQNYL